MTFINNPEDSSFYLVGSLANNTQIQKSLYTFKTNHPFNIKATIKLGKFFLNYYCKKIQEPFFVTCTPSDNERGKITGRNLVIHKKSMDFHFSLNEDFTEFTLE